VKAKQFENFFVRLMNTCPSSCNLATASSLRIAWCRSCFVPSVLPIPIFTVITNENQIGKKQSKEMSHGHKQSKRW